MNSLKRKVAQLEKRTSKINLHKSDILPWALDHAKKTMRSSEISFEKRMMGLYQACQISVPIKFTFPESEIKRRAEYYTKTYPNLQDCIEGEDLKRKKMRAEMMPSIKALKNALRKIKDEEKNFNIIERKK